jgi:4-amino-4-deoxy-L-arabinose transferase-like glycosyltransferase
MKVWLIALFALMAARLVLAAVIPVAPDEAYYFMWSQHLQAGYLDHPPMVALWIWLGTWVAGPGALGIRLLGPVSAALGTLFLYDAGENFFPGRRAGLVAALLLNATLAVGVGAVVMGPDTPLVFFWGLALAGLARLERSGDARWWLCIGAAAGCALLSKYTGLLLVAGVGGWLLSSESGRAQLRSVWPWAGLGLALLIFTPDIAWNAAHHWVSYAKQGGRVAGFDAGRGLQFLAELLASVFFLATPVIFGLGLAGLAQRGVSRLLLWLTILPASVFLEHTLTDRVQANWVAILFPPACLAAAALPAFLRRRWLTCAALSGFILTGLVYWQALAAPFPIPAAEDPTALQLAGWENFVTEATASDPAFITSDDYATAAMLAYDAPNDIPVVGFDLPYNIRWRYFSYPPFSGGTGILLTRRADAKCPHLRGHVSRRRGAEVIAVYRVCSFTQGSHPGFWLPRP